MENRRQGLWIGGKQERGEQGKRALVEADVRVEAEAADEDEDRVEIEAEAEAEVEVESELDIYVDAVAQAGCEAEAEPEAEAEAQGEGKTVQRHQHLSHPAHRCFSIRLRIFSCAFTERARHEHCLGQ